MDNSSSRGSYVSLTEGESGSIPEYPLPHLGNTFHTHKYNTRLSARRSTLIGSKELFVDLSSSIVETPRSDFQIVPSTWKNHKRRDSNSSEDSREFDFGHQVSKQWTKVDTQLQWKYAKMFEVNPCMPRTNWLKYFVLLSLTAVLYVYIRLMHNTDIIKKIQNDLVKLRVDFEGTRYTLSQVEGIALQLKRSQEKLEKDLHKMIASELETFSSDKTGKTDFALESIGGKIVQLSPGTENFEQAVSVLGMKLCDGKHGPRAMLQADMSPGHCWAIKGSNGGAIIKLLGNVKINAVSLEHISQNLSPTGEISSAPKNFSVWGLKMPADRGILLGDFAYNVKGPLVQTYSIVNSNYFEFVEFRVMSNQGNPDFTCIYRFRVHGSLEKTSGH